MNPNPLEFQAVRSIFNEYPIEKKLSLVKILMNDINKSKRKVKVVTYPNDLFLSAMARNIIIRLIGHPELDVSHDIFTYDRIPRHHPYLVTIVEELGDKSCIFRSPVIEEIEIGVGEKYIIGYNKPMQKIINDKFDIFDYEPSIYDFPELRGEDSSELTKILLEHTVKYTREEIVKIIQEELKNNTT